MRNFFYSSFWLLLYTVNISVTKCEKCTFAPMKLNERFQFWQALADFTSKQFLVTTLKTSRLHGCRVNTFATCHCKHTSRRQLMLNRANFQHGIQHLSDVIFCLCNFFHQFCDLHFCFELSVSNATICKYQKKYTWSNLIFQMQIFHAFRMLLYMKLFWVNFKSTFKNETIVGRVTLLDSFFNILSSFKIFVFFYFCCKVFCFS